MSTELPSHATGISDQSRGSLPVRVAFGSGAFGQRAGGISRCFAEIHRELLCLGIQSRIYAGLSTNMHLEGLPAVHSLRAADFPGRGSINRQLDGLLWRAFNRKTIVHDTWYAARRPPGTYAVTVHDLAFARFPHLFPMDQDTASLQRAAAESADVVFVVSASTKRDLLEYTAVAEDRIVMTPLGVRPARQSAPSPRAADQLLYVGRRDHHKNWATVVSALSVARRTFPFRMTCLGGGAFTPSENALLGRLQLTAAVQQTDVDDAGLAAAYGTSLGLMYPSSYEGFGLPVLEAMALGCPVVASQAAALVEVSDGAAAHVDAKDVTGWAEAMLALLEDPARERRIAAGHRRSAQFTWRETALRTLRGYVDAQERGRN